MVSVSTDVILAIYGNSDEKPKEKKSIYFEDIQYLSPFILEFISILPIFIHSHYPRHE